MIEVSSTPPSVELPPVAGWRKLRAFIEISKPRIVSMVLVTAALGYFLAARGIASWQQFLIMMLGTGLSCAGSGVLNCYIERDVDGLMRRTHNRPLVTGVLQPHEALAFGVLLVLGGVALLAWQVNLLTGFLSLLTAFLYVVVYTPLKRVTWLNTSIGAIPGALPPLGGWAAATGGLEIGGWVLFLILFIWQHPHFYAIAWMYRDDYARGGFKMLPVVEPDGISTFRQIIWYSLLLLPVSVLPTVLGMSGMVYLVGSLILGISMLRVGIQLSRSHSGLDARRLLRASIIYLPLLLALIVFDGGIWR